MFAGNVFRFRFQVVHPTRNTDRWFRGTRKARNFSSTAVLSVDQSLVDSQHDPEFDGSSAVVYPQFCSSEEESLLLDELKYRFKRKRYEQGHWDSVIRKFKETELFDEGELSKSTQTLFQRVRDTLSTNHLSGDDKTAFLPCHAIDLHPDGELNAHIDSIRFSGHLVAGLSLQSDAIMRLRHQDDNDRYLDLHLPRLSLYVLSGSCRYRYSHELLNGSNKFRDCLVERDHRISVIFRDTKEDAS